MPWRQVCDSENPQNRIAGNGGDLVKHTVYLTVLDYLLAHSPWSNELRVRECHAGRGMCRIPDEDNRRPLLECLYDPVDADVGVLLHDAQRGLQSALGVWPDRGQPFKWYGGSAVVNARRLGCAQGGRHRLELYEKAVDTRRILRAVFADPGLQLPRLDVQIFPQPEDHREFDGELHIENNVAAWDSQDLILLDPFAMWRQDKDLPQRICYRRIIEGLLARRQESPLLILFWTWGNNFPVAKGDLDGTNPRVLNGYQELRGLLHDAKRHVIRVTWRWELQFAMWVLVPDSHVNALCAALQRCCDDLRDHLLQHGCEKQDVEVAVDSGDSNRQSPIANPQSAIENRQSVEGKDGRNQEAR